MRPGARALVVTLVVVTTTVAAAGWFMRGAPTPGWIEAPPELRAILWPEPVPVTDFALSDQFGEPFGPGRLADRWTFMFFGYLQCPDVCPMTLHTMKTFRELLLARDPDSASHAFVFVTVDPEHDSLEDLGAYVAYFDPEFVGLGGKVDEMRKLTRRMAVMSVDVSDGTGVRRFDHTSSIMVLDPLGRAVAALPPPHDPRRMVARFLQLQAYLRAR